MRKALLLAAILLCLCLPVWSEAQSCDGCGIGYSRASLPSGGGTLTGPLLLPNGTSTAPSWAFAGEPGTGAYYSGTNTIKFMGGYGGTFELFQLSPTYSVYYGTGFRPGTDDNTILGLASPQRAFKELLVLRDIMGSKPQALPDNTKTAFVSVDVAAASYGGGDIIWSLYCADANDRVSRSGRLPFAIQNTGGTETCAVGTTSATADVTNNAKAFTTVTFTCADGGANKIQIEVLADCTIATPTTLTIEYRLDMPKINTVTPAT